MSSEEKPVSARNNGDVFWAFHLRVEETQFFNSAGDLLTRLRRNDPPCKVVIPVKPHLAVIVGSGDVGCRGFLVCYFSSHETKPGDQIPRKPLPGICLKDGKQSYLFEMVPTYCHESFFASNKPEKTLNPLQMEFVYGRLLWATRTNSTSVQDVDNPDDPRSREFLRQLVRAWTHPQEEHVQTERAERKEQPFVEVLDGTVM